MFSLKKINFKITVKGKQIEYTELLKCRTVKLLYFSDRSFTL